MSIPAGLNAVPPPMTNTAPQRDAVLHQRAVQLEAAFLSEMLKHAGFGAARDSFGGGIGEEQFASFLRDEQAGNMARAGGVGLAETIFHALQKGERDA